MLHQPTSIEAEAGAQLLAETIVWLRQRLNEDWPAKVQ
jgi:hypothetical protein